jgi:hypothetical protein
MLKRSSTLFLKFVIFLIALPVALGLLWFPQTEGRAVNLDLISIYTDPFIIYIFIGSIPFFTGLYQAFKLLGYIEQNKAFSQSAVDTLRNMKYCALTLIGFIAPALAFIFYMSKTQTEDGAGPIALGLVVIFAAAVIATAAGVFQKLLQNAVDIKSENDLTV